MRNPKRLNPFYVEMGELHEENFPDWRFGQLMLKFFSWMYRKYHRDCFFPEEKEMLNLFKDFCETESKTYDQS